jgi:capsular polysaccharide biosynthesis protein
MLRLSGLSFQSVGITTTVKSYAIENAVLDATSGLIFQDQLVIPETSYFAPEGADHALPTQRSGLVRLDDDEDHIIGYNNAHGGYQHWLTQCVPAIDWALRQQRPRNIRLVLPPLASWQEDILAILGCSDLPRVTVKPGTFYFLPHVEYSEFLNGTTSFGVCLSGRDTARRILDRLPSNRLPYEILVVPCSNPYYGKIGNEDEVLDLLRRRGAYILDPRLSTTERINLFRHADVVIGPFGQGLSDILFCKPGALLWEWMPEHHQNASINRLAQAAELDYWADLFKSDPASAAPGQWVVDLDTVARRLSEISQRLALRAAAPPASPMAKRRAPARPLDELLLAFESLGDNCEFGLVQRRAGVEPLGLLRFAGMSLDRLVKALEAKFDGIGTADTVTVYLAGEPGRREFMVHETWLDTRYHTFVLEGEIDPEALRQREARRLAFLRRKMLEDLITGEKIWVWREFGMRDPARLQPLLNALRALGPNILFWVVSADEDHEPGIVECLEPDFIKGYVERLAPYENATDIRPLSWFEACENAYDLCRPDQVQPAPAEAIVAAPPRILSAIEFLTLNQPTVPSTPTAKLPNQRRSWLSRLRHALGS